MFFPSTNPTVAIVASLATYGVGYVARPIGAVRARPSGATPMAARTCCLLCLCPDGPLDHGGRAASDLSAGRGLGAGSARGPAPDPGFCGRGRDFGRELDDSRTRAVRTARLFRELHPAGRAGRADPGGGGLSAVELWAVERGLRRLGMARAVPAQRSRADRRLYHPARGRGDARVRRRAGARRRAEGAGPRRVDQPLAGHAAGRLHGADERHSGGGDDLRRRLRRSARLWRRHGQDHLSLDSGHRQHRRDRRDPVRRRPFGPDRPAAADHRRLARGGPHDLRLSLCDQHQERAARVRRSRS